MATLSMATEDQVQARGGPAISRVRQNRNKDADIENETNFQPRPEEDLTRHE
jgi:hypothetical protein